MERSVSIIQTAAALRTARTRRVTPTGPEHRASRSASPSDVVFAKACDLSWGREQGADQESEEVPTFTLADSSDDVEPDDALHPAGRAASSRRCTALSRRVLRRVRRLPRLLRPGTCPTSPVRTRACRDGEDGQARPPWMSVTSSSPRSRRESPREGRSRTSRRNGASVSTCTRG